MMWNLLSLGRQTERPISVSISDVNQLGLVLMSIA